MMTALALTVGVLGCGNNKSADKVLSGVHMTGDGVSGGGTGSEGGGGLSGGNSAAVNSAGAQGALVGVNTVGQASQGLSGVIPGAPGVRAPAPFGATYTSAGDGYYWIEAVQPDGDYSKIKCLCPAGTVFDPNDVVNFTSPGLGTALVEYFERSEEDGSETLGRFTFSTVGGNLNSLTMTGNIKLTFGDGAVNYTVTDFALDGRGNATAGKLVGSGSFPSMGISSLAMELNVTSANTITGTATINGQVLQIYVGPDGVGYYTDQTGTHVIPEV